MIISNFSNENIEKRSLYEINRIIDWVLEAVDYSQQALAPKLITNVGGASYDFNFKLDKPRCFEKLSKLNEKLKKLGIEFRPQTMPPFPWHFGGQGFHNLFVDFEDILLSQQYSNLIFCFDSSHSWLSSKHLNFDFYNGIKEIKDFVDYIHLADARYPGEEGIQIGTGEIDIFRVFDDFELGKGNRMWIPEIWKGHLDNFNGFIVAMNKIRACLDDK